MPNPKVAPDHTSSMIAMFYAMARCSFNVAHTLGVEGQIEENMQIKKSPTPATEVADVGEVRYQYQSVILVCSVVNSFKVLCLVIVVQLREELHH